MPVIARSLGALAVLMVVLTGCGGGRSAQQRARAGAEAEVRALAMSSSGHAVAACRTLTLATRRVIVRLSGDDGARSCSRALVGFTSRYGLDPQLARSTTATATLSGDRAQVRVDGIRAPLTAVRTGATWRVSLISFPGVRGDLAAARACAGYATSAERLPLPGRSSTTLAAQLRAQAALLATFGRRLGALPPGGPPRVGLPVLQKAIAFERSRLLTGAREVASGRTLYAERLLGATSQAQLRTLLQGSRSALRCPKPPIEAAPAVALKHRLADACEVAGATFRRLGTGRRPASRAELRAYEGSLAGAIRGIGRAAAAPRRLPAPIARLRDALRRDSRAEAAGIVGFADLHGLAQLPAAFDEVQYHAARVDAALARLDSPCVVPRIAPPAPGVVRSD